MGWDRNYYQEVIMMIKNIVVMVIDTLRKDYAQPLEKVLTKWGGVHIL